MALIKVLEWVHRLRHLGCPPMVRRHQDAGRRSRELCHNDRRPLSRTFPAPSLSLSRLSWEDAGVAHGAPDGCEERWVWCVVEEAGVHGTELGPRTDQPRRQRRRTQTTRRLRHRPARGDGTPSSGRTDFFQKKTCVRTLHGRNIWVTANVEYGYGHV